MTEESSRSTPARSAARPLSGLMNVVALVLQLLAAVAFLAAGVPKLSGAKPMVAVFAKIGLGQWFRILTGTLEVLSAFGLFLPRAVFFAALLLCAIMIGAIVAHLTILGGNPFPAICLLLLAGTIAYLRRP